MEYFTLIAIFMRNLWQKALERAPHQIAPPLPQGRIASINKPYCCTHGLTQKTEDT